MNLENLWIVTGVLLTRFIYVSCRTQVVGREWKTPTTFFHFQFETFLLAPKGIRQSLISCLGFGVLRTAFEALIDTKAGS